MHNPSGAVRCTLPLSFLVLGPIVGAAPNSAAKPIDKSKTYLIIHADDAGMCHSANIATMEALEKGIVTSASVMVPCPWFPEMAAWCRKHPKADVGLHLTLTSEWEGYRWGPAAPRDRVPGLVDPDGYFWRSVENAARHATAHEVEIELRAQIEKALRAGMHPTHLDTHMGAVYARDDFFQVYIRLGREYHIPCMVIHPTPAALKMMRDHRVHLKPGTLKSVEQLEQPMLDVLVTGVRAGELTVRRKEWLDVLGNLRPGITQIIIHLAKDDPEIRHVTHSWRARWNDYRIFTDPMIRTFLEAHGIQQTSWRDLNSRP